MSNSICPVNLNEDLQSIISTSHGFDSDIVQNMLRTTDQKWFIGNCGEEGLNVFYHICAPYPQNGEELNITLPWLAQETCPNCRGEGIVYSWGENNRNYEAIECKKCCGEGTLNYDCEIPLTIIAQDFKPTTIFKRNAGRLDAKSGLRGDMVIAITWLDEKYETQTTCTATQPACQ